MAFIGSSASHVPVKEGVYLKDARLYDMRANGFTFFVFVCMELGAQPGCVCPPASDSNYMYSGMQLSDG